ncbi:tRNA (guanosine(37)-N1)-methyltransferase TrmD [Candidatus Protochlamydia phocaeensis]|uniref:tRNA (guanosine(37)-N1)-methyltransferase TrmD n=1 Tax=Candidatus Protochlamydia phocaeensis TaxID=1414722 RepID=UPI0008395C13|nr:tRNA (guanosine(37)-N1)-methyltransferase TrmD [Candidatus Protochlamydia phocaeensis]
MFIDILSLFPGYFKGPFDESIIKRARERGLITIRLTDIRDFADNRYRRVDDRPYGGGPGMVMMPQPVTAAIRHVKSPQARVIYLSPQGSRLNAAKCRQLAQESHLILLCGHYEGIDQRVLDREVDEEISIGDFVLTNGCLAAIVLLDGVIRFIPHVLGHASAAEEDSFEKGLLDYPHYTRPEVFEEAAVPSVLLSGNHQEIAKWRHEQALKKTGEMRPDLLL